MADPYQILGVSPSATDEEVTNAYRRLAKKYHPDLNPGNPAAAQKMQEVNSAYDQIKSMRQNGGGGQRQAGGYGQSGQQQRTTYQQRSGSYESWYWDPFTGFNQRQYERADYSSIEIKAARSYIQNGYYQEALDVLARSKARDGDWYYYSAQAHAGLGNRITALNHAQEAVRLDPDNQAYRLLLQQMKQGNYAYQAAGEQYGFHMTNPGSSLCSSLCLSWLCCQCGGCGFCV